MSIDEQFNAAVKVIQSLPKDGFFQPSNEMKLKFYAYFKQATEGPNHTKKPAFYDIINKYKWDAWKQCGDMSKTEAMKLYVEELKKVIETISLTHEVSQFLDVLEPFYEFLPEEVTNNNNNNNNNDNNNKINQNDDQGENNNNQVTTTTTEHGEGFISYDSDGDEFADTIDDTKQSMQSENNDPPPVFRNSFDDDYLNENNIINYSFHSIPSSPLKNNNKDYNADGGNETNRFRNDNSITSTNQINNNYNNNVALGFNEQLAVAIFQLQNSLDRISNRIHIIESKQQHIHNNNNNNKNGNNGNNNNNNNNNYWPFKELSTKTTIFILTWPVVIFFLMNYLKRFRKK